MKAGLFLFLCLLAAPAMAQDTVFTEVTPLSGNAELTRRLLTPLTVVQMRKALARDRQSLAEQPLNIAGEKFLVHVPPREPANGYGLMCSCRPGGMRGCRAAGRACWTAKAFSSSAPSIRETTSMI